MIKTVLLLLKIIAILSSPSECMRTLIHNHEIHFNIDVFKTFIEHKLQKGPLMRRLRVHTSTHTEKLFVQL